MKRFFALLILALAFALPAVAQTKAATRLSICVWADGESPGNEMTTRGESITAPDKEAVRRIQRLVVAKSRADKTLTIVDPCPQTGENIELDVIVGNFRAGYVASVAATIQGKEHIHISSNVVGANTEEALAWSIGWTFESLRLQLLLRSR